MSDVKSWIDERRAIHGKGTDVLLRNPYELNREYDMWGEDAEAIADAHNTLPAALSAIEAVLELHCSATTYQNVSECENEDEDHEDERHTESEDGTPICLDLPDYAACRSCQVDGEPVDWPCATVRAIEGAIND